MAWEIAGREGLAGVSLREVAAAVGMRAPSLYSYFDSKNAMYDAMFAQGAREYLERQENVPVTGDALRDLQRHAHTFVGFCVENPQRYQLLFQRTIPGFEPSAASYAVAVEALEGVRRLLAAIGIEDPRAIDMLTAVGTGLAAQQIANDPGGTRWLRLVDEAMEMFLDHVSRNRTPGQRR